MANRSLKPKPFKASMWGGFVDGRLYLSSDEHGYLTAPLFRSKAEAKRRFEDVRRVEISETATTDGGAV